MHIVVTEDSRSIAPEEWRVVPGFRKYKATKDGDIWSRAQAKLLKESQNKTTGAYFYHLHSDTGRKTTRNFQSIVDLAFPELAIPKKKKVGGQQSTGAPKYRSKFAWFDIPGWPTYQIHSDRSVRVTTQRYMLKSKVNSLNGEEYVILTETLNGKQQSWPMAINDLIAMSFPEELKEERLLAA